MEHNDATNMSVALHRVTRGAALGLLTFLFCSILALSITLVSRKIGLAANINILPFDISMALMVGREYGLLAATIGILTWRRPLIFATLLGLGLWKFEVVLSTLAGSEKMLRAGKSVAFLEAFEHRRLPIESMVFSEALFYAFAIAYGATKLVEIVPKFLGRVEPASGEVLV